LEGFFCPGGGKLEGPIFKKLKAQGGGVGP